MRCMGQLCKWCYHTFKKYMVFPSFAIKVSARGVLETQLPVSSCWSLVVVIIFWSPGKLIMTTCHLCIKPVVLKMQQLCYRNCVDGVLATGLIQPYTPHRNIARAKSLRKPAQHLIRENKQKFKIRSKKAVWKSACKEHSAYRERVEFCFYILRDFSIKQIRVRGKGLSAGLRDPSQHRSIW